MLDRIRSFFPAKTRIVILLVFLATVFSLAGLYVCSIYYPFISKNLIWKDISFDNLYLSSSGPSYTLSAGELTIGNTKRTLKPESSLVLARENDAVLRLAIFAEINNESPLLGGPGLDAGALNSSIIDLSNNQAKLKNILGIKDDIYPIDYLKKIITVNTAELKFEQDKTLQNANELLAAEKSAANSYQTFAIFLRNKLANTKLPADLFVQSGGITSQTTILSDLDKTIANASNLKGQIAARSACLNYSTIFCKRENLKIFNDYSDVPTIAPAEVFPGHDIMTGQPVKADGPYEVATRCWRETSSSANTLLLYALRSSDGKTMSPQLAGNIYFEKLSVDQFGEKLFDQYAADGVGWDIASIDAGYTCNDMEYQPNLATLSAYYSLYGQKPLFSGQDTRSWPTEITSSLMVASNLESIFASEKYPSDTTLSKLAKSYASIYNQIILLENHNPNASDKKTLDTIKGEVLYRFNFINCKLAGYDKLLGFLAFRTGTHALMSELNPKGQTELDYVYFMRNAYGITLGGFSPSVWQSTSRLEYLVSDTHISSALVDYDDFVKQFGIDYEKKVMSVTRDLVVAQLRKAAGL